MDWKQEEEEMVCEYHGMHYHLLVMLVVTRLVVVEAWAWVGKRVAFVEGVADAQAREVEEMMGVVAC